MTHLPKYKLNKLKYVNQFKDLVSEIASGIKYEVIIRMSWIL